MVDIDTSKIRRILVIMMGGIGDMILLTPALNALRKGFPSSTIYFLIGPYGAEKVIEGSHLINKKIMIDPKKHNRIKGKIKLIQQLRKEKFCLSITSTGTNPLKSGLLCYLSGIKFRLGENIDRKGFFYNLKVPLNENRHDVESNLSLIQKLGIKAEEKSLYIHRSLEDKNFAQRIFSDLNLKRKIVIGMHPGSGIHQARFRRWPKERFAQLADRIIRSFGASVILFGGPEEMSLSSEIMAMMRSNPIVMTGKTTLNQAAALIEKCNLFISNDSGLMHVACAVNTPTIGIYGPTNYKKLGPYSDSARIIRKELDCSPCYKRERVKCSQLDCFQLITVEDVLNEVSELLKKNTKSAC